MYFPLLIPHSWEKRSAAQPQTIYSEAPIALRRLVLFRHDANNSSTVANR